MYMCLPYIKIRGPVYCISQMVSDISFLKMKSVRTGTVSKEYFVRFLQLILNICGFSIKKEYCENQIYMEVNSSGQFNRFFSAINRSF